LKENYETKDFIDIDYVSGYYSLHIYLINKAFILFVPLPPPPTPPPPLTFSISLNSCPYDDPPLKITFNTMYKRPVYYKRYISDNKKSNLVIRVEGELECVKDDDYDDA
jgi:hypothetical protein